MTTRRLAKTFPVAALAQPAALRTAFDAWWDAASLDALPSPPTVVRLVRHASSDLHEASLRCALDPLARIALRRATRRTSGVRLLYDQDAAQTPGEEAIEVEIEIEVEVEVEHETKGCP
jgi:hypothetical protein